MSQNNKKPPADFDGSYRKLLSNELLLRQLLERFVAAELLGELDFETLERVETSFLKRDMGRRHSDVLWKLKRKNTHGDYIYCVLLLELQSSPDPLMALRILDYAVEIYRQQIIANRSRVLEHGLPPLLPIVLHHSNQTWSAKTNLGDLIAPRADDPSRNVSSSSPPPSLRLRLPSCDWSDRSCSLSTESCACCAARSVAVCASTSLRPLSVLARIASP